MTADADHVVEVGDEEDVAAVFATAWNARHTDQAQPADFWPCCRIMAEAGLLVPDETNLTAVSIGPFRLAVPKDNRPVVDFVEVLFPSVAASAAMGQPVTGAVSGVLTAACTTFVKLYRQGTVFGRSARDRLRWNVLMAVRDDNARAVDPSTEVVVATVRERSGTTPPTDTAVRDAIDWLLGSQPPLLVRLDDGGLRTTV